MAGESFRPHERITGDRRFEQIRSSGVRAGDDCLFIRALANDLGYTRLGLAVGRNIGGSVVRARLRRIFREAFRRNKAKLPGGLDLLLSPRRGAPAATLAEISESLVRLAGLAAVKLERRGQGTEA